MTEEQLQLYLDRLGWTSPPEPTTSTLQDLHAAHLRRIPFECLDVCRGIDLSLDLDMLCDKILRRRRGGFCYELNTLFAHLLAGLGYAVDLLSAQVMNPDGVLGPPFDHLALRVKGEEALLCDVGFGQSFLLPLPFDRRHLSDAFGEHRLVEQGPHSLWLERKEDAQWRKIYLLDLRARDLEEFTEMFLYHQRNEASPFPRTFLATIATENGRRTVRDMDCIETQGPERKRRRFRNEDDRRAYLRTHMGVEIEEV